MQYGIMLLFMVVALVLVYKAIIRIIREIKK